MENIIIKVNICYVKYDKNRCKGCDMMDMNI